MKLLFCPFCQDAVALQTELRHCSCKVCCARYTGHKNHAEWNGEGCVLAIDSDMLQFNASANMVSGRVKFFEIFILRPLSKTLIINKELGKEG